MDGRIQGVVCTNLPLLGSHLLVRSCILLVWSVIVLGFHLPQLCYHGSYSGFGVSTWFDFLPSFCTDVEWWLLPVRSFRTLIPSGWVDSDLKVILKLKLRIDVDSERLDLWEYDSEADTDPGWDWFWKRCAVVYKSPDARILIRTDSECAFACSDADNEKLILRWFWYGVLTQMRLTITVLAD